MYSMCLSIGFVKMKKKKKKKQWTSTQAHLAGVVWTVIGQLISKACNWQSRCNTNAGSSPRCGKGFLSFQWGVRTAPVRASTSVCKFKIQNTASHIPLFGHTKIQHTLTWTGSTAFEVTVPYPCKATRISRKGQWILCMTLGLLKEFLSKHKSAQFLV